VASPIAAVLLSCFCLFFTHDTHAQWGNIEGATPLYLLSYLLMSAPTTSALSDYLDG